MAKKKKEKKYIIRYPNKIVFFTGTPEKVKEDYEDFMGNCTDIIVNTLMSGTPDNLVVAVIHREDPPRDYF